MDASDEDTDLNTFETDWTPSGRPSTAVIEAVAAVTGREPTDLPSLHRRVDVDALDALVTHGVQGIPRQVDVTFEYAGVEVTVNSQDGIVIRPGSDTNE